MELTLFVLKRATRDSYYWKWVLVALHNSIQGFMVCALRDHEGLNVLKDRCVKQLKEAQKNKESLPKLELDTFLNLYQKIQSDYMLINPQSKKFIAKDAINRSIRHLNRLRNHFIHFSPKSWTAEISTFPSLSMQCLKVINFLVFSSGNIELNRDAEKQIARLIREMEMLLAKCSYEK